MEKRTHLLPETRETLSQEQFRKAKEVEYGGLLTLSVIVLQALLSYEKSDFAIQSAFYLFALGIPLLASPFVGKAHYRSLTKWAERLGDIGVIFCGVGVEAVFVHFSLLLGVLFFATCIVAFSVVREGR